MNIPINNHSGILHHHCLYFCFIVLMFLHQNTIVLPGNHDYFNQNPFVNNKHGSNIYYKVFSRITQSFISIRLYHKTFWDHVTLMDPFLQYFAIKPCVCVSASDAADIRSLVNGKVCSLSS